MNEKLKALYEKYKDLIPYVIFGVLTTIVNYVSYWLFAHPLGCGTVFSTAVAWVLSVLFAYVTNRRWVFHSEAKGAKAIGKEFAAFLGARLGTGLLDMLIMYLCAQLPHGIAGCRALGLQIPGKGQLHLFLRKRRLLQAQPRGAQLQVFFRSFPAGLAKAVVCAQLVELCRQRAFALFFAAHRCTRSDHRQCLEQQGIPAPDRHRQNFSFVENR